MAISTLDGVVAGMHPPQPFYKIVTGAEAVGVLHSTFYMAGMPAAAAAPTPGIAGAALTAYDGQIPFPGAVGGQNIYLASVDYSSVGNIPGMFLYDRLWHNSGITVTTTTAQTVNSATLPARDANGSTNGDGVLVALEVSTITGNGSAVTTITMSYTNSAGTSGRTGTISTFPATAQVGTTVFFNLEGADKGVRSIQSITLGTSLVSGVVHLVAVRQLATVSTNSTAGASTGKDVVQLGMPRCYDSTVPYVVLFPSSTIPGNTFGQIIYTQG